MEFNVGDDAGHSSVQTADMMFDKIASKRKMRDDDSIDSEESDFITEDSQNPFGGSLPAPPTFGFGAAVPAPNPAFLDSEDDRSSVLSASVSGSESGSVASPTETKPKPKQSGYGGDGFGFGNDGATAFPPAAEDAYGEDDALTHSERSDDTHVSRPGPTNPRREKLKLLGKIKVMVDQHKISAPMSVTMHSSMTDIQTVYEIMLETYQKRQAVQSYRKMIVMGSTITEWMNNKYDPFDVHLNGWSQEVYSSVDTGDYDEIFRELHEKYKSDSQMSPEMRLMMMLAGSAFMHHTFHKTTKAAEKMFAGLGATPGVQRPTARAAPPPARPSMPAPSGFDNLMKNMGLA